MMLFLLLLLFGSTSEEQTEELIWLPRMAQYHIQLPEPVQYASFYSDVFIDCPMKSGEKFQQWKMVGAMQGVEMGTKVRVTNLRNHKSTVIVIKDVGPFIPGRCMDLSKKAFSMVEDKKYGVFPVKVEILE